MTILRTALEIYSEKEIALFHACGMENHLIEFLGVDMMYRLTMERIFVHSLTGPQVNIFRRVFKGYQYDQVFRRTEAFEKLFEPRPDDFEHFHLTPEQVKKLGDWLEKNPVGYSGAIGGALEFMFAPTSLGVSIKVRNSKNGKEIDLSDYEDW